MRNRLLISSTSMAIIVAITGAITAGIVDDRYEERLDELEARVARLEEEVGISPDEDLDVEDHQAEQDEEDEQSAQDGKDGEDGQSNVVISGSSSSSSSSVQSNSNSYTATYSSNGDEVMPFEIDDAGTYRVTASAGASFEMRIETADGESIPVFELKSETGETVTASGHLEPDAYILDVSSDSTWSVIVTSHSN
ncbi:MAG: hypothetical protein M3173_06370 [Chloroflexota bacterium]|nr:hypothetical protein [Chloroflexota bacterium]